MMAYEKRTKEKCEKTSNSPFGSRDVWAKKVADAFLRHAHFEVPSEVADLIFEVPRDKLRSPTYRSHYIKVLAEHMLRSQGRLEEGPLYEPLIIQLALCAEVTMSVQYYHNFIFDGKAGVTNSLAIREAVLKANLLKSWFFRYIQVAFEEAPFVAEISTMIDGIFNDTDLGQYIEGRYNSYEAYLVGRFNTTQNYFMDRGQVDWSVIENCTEIVKKRVNLSAFEEVFIQNYFLRLCLTSGSLFKGYLIILSKLLHFNNNSLLNWASYIGIMMQLVNDITDFVPDQDTKVKFPQDQQSDIWNKNLTLPLVLYLNLHPNKNTVVRKLLNAYKPKKI